MTSKPEEYRAQALHCRLMADQVKSPLDKELWLQLAADWMAMASVHERFGTGGRSVPKRTSARWFYELSDLNNFLRPAAVPFGATASRAVEADKRSSRSKPDTGHPPPHRSIF